MCTPGSGGTEGVQRHFASGKETGPHGTHGILNDPDISLGQPMSLRQRGVPGDRVDPLRFDRLVDRHQRGALQQFPQQRPLGPIVAKKASTSFSSSVTWGLRRNCLFSASWSQAA